MYKDWDKDQLEKHLELIKRNRFTHLLHPKQKEVVNYIKDNPKIEDFGIYACRKIGKTFMLVVFGWEFCAQNPGVVVRHILPTLKNAKEVVIPVMDELRGMIPKEYHPDFFATNAEYRFANGSRYILCGSSSDSLDSARGPKCDVLMFDEVAFSEERSYDNAQDSVFKPQQSLVKRPIRIYATTPPRTPDHPFIIKTVPKIEAQGAFFKFTIYDNPLMSVDRREKIKADLGEESNAWKREYMAEIVVDDNWRVVPEFDPAAHVVEDKPKGEDFFGKSTSFAGYEVADYGIGEFDFTGILCAVFDHNKQEVIVVGEKLLKSPIPDEFVVAWNSERETHLSDCHSISGTIDAFASMQHAFRVQYGLTFLQPLKGKTQENVAFLRNCLEHGKVKIHSSCKSLIRQLNGGIWKENKKDFERSNDLGHLDLLICLVYLVRAVKWNSRPGGTSINFQLGSKRSPNDRKNTFRNLR